MASSTGNISAFSPALFSRCFSFSRFSGICDHCLQSTGPTIVVRSFFSVPPIKNKSKPVSFMSQKAMESWYIGKHQSSCIILCLLMKNSRWNSFPYAKVHAQISWVPTMQQCYHRSYPPTNTWLEIHPCTLIDIQFLLMYYWCTKLLHQLILMFCSHSVQGTCRYTLPETNNSHLKINGWKMKCPQFSGTNMANCQF